MWFLFAKFTAIYPECTNQPDWIAITMMQNHVKGRLAKATLGQIKSVTRQRETNLIQSLKIKLNSISKKVQNAKHRVRYVWDLIIQGNVHELEGGILRAASIVEECETEFHHMLRIYPNSRFVARSYSMFLRDVIGDYDEHMKWQQNIANLQRGISLFPDQAHV